jgi:hypothetical protein
LGIGEVPIGADPHPTIWAHSSSISVCCSFFVRGPGSVPKYTLAGAACNAAARRRALVAAATMIGAVTMSRLVTDPELSAEILFAAEKNLAADQP